MSIHELDSLAFNTPHRVHTSNSLVADSTRSSLDKDYLRLHKCEVSIRDEVTIDDASFEHENANVDTVFDKITVTQGRDSSVLPTELKTRLEARNASKTRWINVVGWSEGLMDNLARLYLDEHGCLDFNDSSKQMLGGPIKCKDSKEFIWIQTNIWFLGGRNPNWSSVRKSEFRMVICLPTSSEAGTLITNFRGRAALAEEISRICTDIVLENHAMGLEALSCVWILAFSILRSIAEQMDFAFQTFDPTSIGHPSIPQMDNLPFMLERANNLARIDRYISGLDEFSSFFASVRAFQLCQDPGLLDTGRGPEAAQTYQSRNIRERASLELSLAQQKVLRAQRLCSTYMRQYESLVQMTISYGTTQITERLDSGRSIAEKFTTIGIVLAGVSGLISPLALLTSYYGMNVQELVEGAPVSLFDFWQVAMPTLLVCFAGLAFVMLRTMSTPCR